MNATADKLAAALRPFAALLQPEDVAGHDATRPDAQGVYGINSANITLGDLRAAVAALAEHDKAASDPSNPIRALVLRRALENYSEAMDRNARDYRAGKIARDLPGYMRERNAQGCEMRRRVADELLAELARD